MNAYKFPYSRLYFAVVHVMNLAVHARIIEFNWMQCTCKNYQVDASNVNCIFFFLNEWINEWGIDAKHSLGAK